MENPNKDPSYQSQTSSGHRKSQPTLKNGWNDMKVLQSFDSRSFRVLSAPAVLVVSFLLLTSLDATKVSAFAPFCTPVRIQPSSSQVGMVKDEGPIFYNDFEGFGGDGDVQSEDSVGKQPPDDANSLQKYLNSEISQLDEDDVVVGSGEGAISEPTASEFVNFLQKRSSTTIDWTAIQTRQFSLGQDFVLSNYVGNMGFDEVTDWEYYLQSEDDEDEDRQVVQPNPFDKSKYVLFLVHCCSISKGLKTSTVI